VLYPRREEICPPFASTARAITRPGLCTFYVIALIQAVKRSKIRSWCSTEYPAFVVTVRSRSARRQQPAHRWSIRAARFDRVVDEIRDRIAEHEAVSWGANALIGVGLKRCQRPQPGCG
jgi:hypothetical protein